MSSKPTILLISDSPSIPTGMGIAHMKLGKYLYSTEKYNIKSFGWYYTPDLPWPFPWEQANTHDINRPYGHPFNWKGINGIPPTEKDLSDCAGNKIISQIAPQLVIGLADVWMLDWITEIPLRNCFKLIWEFPIDGTPIPKSWTNRVKNADVPVVMTKFAEEEIHRTDSNIKLTRLPRGIDLGEFYKMPIEKEVLRENYLKVAKDKFVVGIFARFQDRKQIDRGLEAFKKFINIGNKKDCLLYLHLDCEDPASINNHKTLMGADGLIEQYGLMNYVCNDPRIKVNKGVSPERLNILYNCMDVTILPTQGEGWGLPLVEAMACGVPSIATDFTSCRELLEGHGQLTKVATFVSGMYNIKRALVDTTDMAEKLDEYYSNKELLIEHSQKGLEHVKKYDGGKIGRLWEQLIDSTLYKEPIFINSKVHTPKHINIYGAVYEDTGFSIVTRGFAEALSDLGAKVKIYEGGGHTAGYSINEKIEKLLSTKVSNDFAIINHMPNNIVNMLPENPSLYKIAYFPWEITKLPADIIETVNRNADACWCNSEFVAKIFEENGIDENLISVIPNGVSTNVNAVPFYLNTKKSYKFLYIGNLGDIRKNVGILIKAFCQVFTDKDDVCLVLKSLPGYKNSDPSEIVENEMMGRIDAPEIIIVHEAIKNLSSLYSACDTYVHVSHAEGWGQPIAEALSMGLNVIAPAYGGYLDFAKDLIIPISYRKCISGDKCIFIPRAEWIDIDFNSLKFKLLETYEKKLKRKHENLVPQLTWKNSAEKIIEKLQTLSINRKEKIKVYFETGKHSLWNQDNELGFKRFAPSKIRFVKEYEKSDFQVLNITRLADRDFIHNKKYICLMHTWGEWAEENHEDYIELFDKAILVYSQLDLNKEKYKMNFFRGPWGVESRYFYKDRSISKNALAITTGEIAATEGIEELVMACKIVGKKVIHVGRNLGYNYDGYIPLSNLSVQEIRDVYNSCYYANGMRRIEGFEKPIVEAVFCGTRPIAFDVPLYRYWFGDVPEYVPESDKKEVTNKLVEIFNGKYRAISEDEEKEFLNKFDWQVVSRNFWTEVLKHV